MPKKTAGEALAENLARLMGEAGLDNLELAKRTRGGLSRRTIQNILKAAHSAKIGSVEAAAAVFEREAWQLLLNKDTLGERMFEILFGDRPLARTPRLQAVTGNGDEGDIHPPGQLPGANEAPRAKPHTRKKR